MATTIVVGGNGQLGADLLRVAVEQGRDAVSLTHSNIDICDTDSIEMALSPIRPRVVINTAACHGANQYTAADQLAFFRLNALGPWNLARWCRQHSAVLIHYSTDYAFGAEPSRDRPYAEADTPCPVNIYGASKVAGELLVRSFCPEHYILRVASLYGRAGCRAKSNSNFVKMTLDKIRKGEDMRVVADQFMSPTWAKAAAVKTYQLLERQGPYGLYHLAGSGVCSWYEFAREIVQLAGGVINVEPSLTPVDEPGAIFLRPRYTALDNANLRRAGLDNMLHWRESLKSYLHYDEGVL